MKLKREDTALLVVDYQERLMPVIHGGEATVQNAVKLIKGMRAMDVHTVAYRQYPKGLGDLVPEIREALGEHQLNDKTVFSACGSPELLGAAEATGKKNFVICGVETHICVLQTAIDLKAAGYQPVLVCDCVSSRKPYDTKIALKRAVQEGVLLTTHEAVLYELLGQAGGEVFKTISKLIK